MSFRRSIGRARAVGVALAVASAGAFVGVTATPASAASSHFVLNGFSPAQGWRVDRHPRILADITGDGRADIVGFGNGGVHTAVSLGNGTFGPARFVVADFGYNQGWRVGTHERFVTDITGDGRADIVGLDEAGLWTSVSLGNGNFSPAQFVLQSGRPGGPGALGRHAQEVTGDGRTDVVVPRSDEVMVAPSDGTGDFIGTRTTGVNQSVSAPGFVADVTGDGRAEVLARDSSRGIVSLRPRPDGSGFYEFNYLDAGADLQLPNTGSSDDFAISVVADVTGGDGPNATQRWRDLVMFGVGSVGTYVAVSNGNGTFRPARLIPGLGGPNGWNTSRHVRTAADVTGGGRDDLVGFGDAGVWIQASLGNGFFDSPRFVLADFGYNQEWRIDRHPRVLADITGDGRADIVGIGETGVHISVNVAL